MGDDLRLRSGSSVPISAGPSRQGPGPAERLVRFEFEETHMASPFKIVLYSTDAATARRASRAAFDRIAALNTILSDYDPESELSRLSQSAGKGPVPVSADLFDVLGRSRAMYERSDGAFDVTIAPVGRLWRRARRDRKLPDPALLAEARQAGRLGQDGARPGGPDRPAQEAGDEARRRRDRQGLRRAGGARRAEARRGSAGPWWAGRATSSSATRRPARQGWTIAIAPLEPGKPATAPPTLLLANAAVSTAGDAERFVRSTATATRTSSIPRPARRWRTGRA